MKFCNKCVLKKHSKSPSLSENVYGRNSLRRPKHSFFFLIPHFQNVVPKVPHTQQKCRRADEVSSILINCEYHGCVCRKSTIRSLLYFLDSLSAFTWNLSGVWAALIHKFCCCTHSQISQITLIHYSDLLEPIPFKPWTAVALLDKSFTWRFCLFTNVFKDTIKTYF